MKQCMDAENLHRRLKKIIGQVKAVDRMVDEDVPCEDILAQINAAKSALHKCGRSYWRAIFAIVSAMGWSTATPTRLSQVSPRRWSGLPTITDCRRQRPAGFAQYVLKKNTSVSF